MLLNVGRNYNNRQRKNNRYGGITIYAKPYEVANRSTGQVFEMLKGKSSGGKITCTVTEMSSDWTKKSGDTHKITVFGIGSAIYKARKSGYAYAMRRKRNMNGGVSMKDLLTVLASK
jgi:hypothetical protein